MLEGFFAAKCQLIISVHQPMGLLHGGASVAWQRCRCGLILFINRTSEVRGIEIRQII
jgi:hypothetical protein